MDRRLFPLSVEFFRQEVEPLIAGHHKRPGRPPGTGHDLFFPRSSFCFKRFGEICPPVLGIGIRFIHDSNMCVKTVFFGLCCTDCSKERLKWIWFGSTAQQLASTVTGLVYLKTNRTLHWTGKKG